MEIKPTGILIDNWKILLIEKSAENSKIYSLPDGLLNENEKISDGLVRIVEEETGLIAEAGDLLYVCDEKSILHMIFEMKKPHGKLNENSFMAPLFELMKYGFSQRFYDLAKTGFPNRGRYYKGIENIGL